MSVKQSAAQQVRDKDIIRLNSVGLSLATIGSELGVHPTTVTCRLAALNIAPADTRRAFMEDIYRRLSKAQQTWLENQLGPHVSIKDFVTSLLVQKFLATSGAPVSHAA